MARSEARISVDIWAPESDFTDLTPGAQWMYFLLLSQPDLAHTGVLALRERRWSRAAAGMTVELVTAHLAELEAARYVVVDQGTEEVLIRSFIRRDKVYRQPQVLRAAADQLALVTSPTLRAAIAVELLRIADEPMPDASKTVVAEMLAALPNPHVDAARDTAGHPAGQGADQAARTTPGERGVVTAVRTASPYPVPRSPDPVPRRTPAASVPRARARETDATRGTRIPDDFEPNAELIAWAREHAPTTSRADHDAFMDYWRSVPGAKGRKLNWPMTWRNWMRKEHQRRTANGARASPNRQRQYGAFVLNDRTVADLERTQRMAALDAADTGHQAIEGRPP